MDEIFEKLKSEIPSCLSPFKLQISDEVLPDSWNSHPEVVTQKVSCNCGSNENRLWVHQTVIGDGETSTLINFGPVDIECLACKSKQLLFSPTLHGWNAEVDKLENFNPGEDPDIDKATLISTDYGQVIVSYSYQAIDEYEALYEDEKVLKPHDFFDTFTVFLKKENGTIETIMADECA